MEAHLRAVGGDLPRAHPDRSIGAILIDAGRLSAQDAERILLVQRESGQRFGDVARQLGLISDADIQFALSRQFAYPYLQPGASAVAREVVAAYEPFSPRVEVLRALRSQLVLRWFDTEVERRSLAVVSPERGEGRSWVAANLAVVFSQQGERTLLIDADLRHPRQHAIFGVDNRAGLSAILAGRGGPDMVQRIPDLQDLSLLPAGAMPPNPHELLSRPLLAQLLEQLAHDFDVILIDTPDGQSCGDGCTLAVRASGALMVTRRHRSRMRLVRRYCELLQQGSATVVGTVINDF